MKTNLLKTAFVVVVMAISANMKAFTAVTSGSWSSATTWGGVGPGNSVSNQDIIIPSGITVDLDMDVTFAGIINSFTVNGTLNSTGNKNVLISQGAFAGSGSVDIHRLTMSGILSTFSFSGTLTLNDFQNQGATIPITSLVYVSDTLDMNSGSLLLNTGGNLTMQTNSNVIVNNGTLSTGGGVFTTGNPYDLWYVGSTKTSGLEANSSSIHDLYINMTDNTQLVLMGTDFLVNGDLYLNLGHLVLNGNKLTMMADLITGAGAAFESSGAADMEVSGPAMTMTNGLYFAAGSSLDELTINRGTSTIQLVSNLAISGTLHLEAGSLSLETPADLVMNAGSLISHTNGYLVQNGGIFNGTASYNVEYIGNSHNSGVGATGSGLNNLTVNMTSNSSSLTLTTDVTVNGNLNMMYGKVDMNGMHALNLMGTFDQTNGTALTGTNNSTLNLNLASSTNDTMWFDISASQIGTLIVNIPASSIITLGSTATVATSLNMMSGKLDVANSIFEVASSGSITGANDLSYVVTSGTGRLRMYLNASGPYVSYPIGTATDYSPVSMQQTNSTPSGYFDARVIDGVWTSGTSGVDISATERVVDKTWILNSAISQTMNINLQAYWMAGNEVNGFDRTQSYITHYTNSAWDSYMAGSASAGPNSTYYSTRTGLTSLSPFAIVDTTVPLSVPVVPVTSFDLYPNPTSDFITIDNGNTDHDPFLYELFDATGKCVVSRMNADTRNQIDLRNFVNGFYIVRITNMKDHSIVNKRIIKS